MAHKAPGKHYREGMSLIEVLRMFPNDATAERWFIKVRWPDGVYCPHCGSVSVQTGTKHKTMPYRCRDCRKWFSVKTGTVMQSSKLGLQVWALASYLITTGIKGQSSMKLHRDLSITQKTAWHLAHRVRETWPRKIQPVFRPTGSGRNFHRRQGEEQALQQEAQGGPWGRRQGYSGRGKGSRHQRRERQGGKGDGRRDPTGLRRRSRRRWRDRLHRRSRRLQGLPFDHETVRHSVSEYVNGQAHTNGIESFWAMLKRGYHGTYHHMSEKHLGRYVGEFSGRHNRRDLDTIDQMQTIATGMIGKRLTYAELIG